MVPAAAVAETFASLKAGLDVRAAGRVVAADSSAFSSGFDELDRALAGGLSGGGTAALEGSSSPGRPSVWAGALAAPPRTGFGAATHDGSLYPPDLQRAGVARERLLLVSAATPLAAARCADILLR